MIRRLLLAGLLFGLGVIAAWAQAPTLSHATPSAALPGKTTTIVINGSNLGEPAGIWTSFGGRATPQATGAGVVSDSEKLACQLTLPADTPVGVGALRVMTLRGLSSLLLFMVDDLPSVKASGTNRSLASAQALTLPVAVDGNCEENSFDYFKFTAKAGQQITVEVVARRLGSQLDPVIRLLDARGRELAYCDDEPGLQADSRFTHKFAAKGEYTLELRDILYQGGSRHRYRLRIGDFPAVSTTYQLGVKRGSRVQLNFAGTGAERLKPVNVSAPPASTGIGVSAKNPSGQSSAFITAVASDLDEVKEAEPNDTPATPTRINIPCAVNGRFATAKDRDLFEFEVAKDQRLLFRATTRSLGSPSEVYLRLQKPDGTKLAENKLADADEGSITNTFSEAGKYQLLVEEAALRGGPEHAYRIEITPFAGFDLSVDADKVEAAVGTNFTLKVSAARRDFKGPIKLSLDGLGDAFAVSDNVIDEGKTNTTLSVAVPASERAGDTLNFRVIGTAKTGESDFQTWASTMPALRKLFPQMAFPPRTLDGSITVGVLPSGVKPAAPPSEPETGKRKKKN